MPLPSPTTTSAVKLNRRPPWTTLATRLMVTTRSRYAVPLSAPPRRSSRRSRRSPPALPRRGVAAISSSFFRYRERSRRSWSQCRALCGCSQGQPAFPGAVRQGSDPAVVGVAAPVEHGGGDARLLCPAGEQLTRPARLGPLVAFGVTDAGFQGRR